MRPVKPRGFTATGCDLDTNRRAEIAVAERSILVRIDDGIILVTRPHLSLADARTLAAQLEHLLAADAPAPPPRPRDKRLP